MVPSLRVFIPVPSIHGTNELVPILEEGILRIGGRFAGLLFYQEQALRRLTVTNSKAWLARIDGRSHIARRAQWEHSLVNFFRGGGFPLLFGKR